MIGYVDKFKRIQHLFGPALVIPSLESMGCGWGYEVKKSFHKTNIILHKGNFNVCQLGDHSTHITLIIYLNW